MTREYEAVIGLEVHAQVNTEAKMFCSCAADYLGDQPNSNVCPVCLGLPGVLPTVNGRAVELTVLTALALECTVAEVARFDRKNYFYPDLPKGYQISQYAHPIGTDGVLELASGDSIGIVRVHLEEDTGKLTHVGDQIQHARSSLVDLNRAGVPLMEIVGKPELHSSDQARAFLEMLRTTLRYIGVCDGDMESGNLRCDANISLRPPGSPAYGVKVEIKNLNSLRALGRALDYEIERQRVLLDQDSEVVQETRGWSEPGQCTISQRAKEYADDYRYFPEPDLPPLLINHELVGSLRKLLPELPLDKAKRLRHEHGLDQREVGAIVAERRMADYFEDLVSKAIAPKLAANWVIEELLPRVSGDGRLRLPPDDLAGLLEAVTRGELSTTQARAAFEEAWTSGQPPLEVVRRLGMTQVSDPQLLETVVAEVIADNSKAVNDYRSGKAAALQFLMSQVMRRTMGQANPQVAVETLRRRLGGDGDEPGS